MKTYTKANKLNFISMLALLCLGSFGVFGQVAQEPDWKWQNPKLIGKNFYDSQFINKHNGWMVGDSGSIMKTTNGGISWQNQISGTKKVLVSIHFINSQIGWVVGASGTILKTTNGGQDWHSQSGNTLVSLNSVQFLSSEIGWIVGSNGKVLKTIDGGSSWQNVSLNSTKILRSVFFASKNIGTIVGNEGTIFNTINGGQNWISSFAPIDHHFTSVYIFDSLSGWAVGGSSGILYRKSGSNWYQYPNYTIKWLSSVAFVDRLNGWAVGERGTIIRTTDGGYNWVQQDDKYHFGNINLQSIHFSNSENGHILGDNGITLQIKLGETGWYIPGNVTNNYLYYVKFLNNKIGFAFGDSGTILKTQSGGAKWQKLTSNTSKNLYCSYFLDTLTGWAVGESGTILKTSNGGENWQFQTSGVQQLLSSIIFFNNQIGIAGGFAGTILKTTNGGNTWQNQSDGSLQGFSSFCRVDTLTAWSIGGTQIKKTTNRGLTWQNQNSGVDGYLFSVHFINNQFGWIVGKRNNGRGAILRTTNGGINWTQDSGLLYFRGLNSVKFIDNLNGWAFGDEGYILNTTDGGLTWKSKIVGYYCTWSSGDFSDPLNGWAVGQYGNIITTKSNFGFDLETPNSLIDGRLSEKTTANCNPSNIPVPNQLVKALPGPYYGISDNQGNYNLRLPLSDTATTFTLQALENNNPAFNVEVVCPPTNQYNIVLDTIPDTLSNKDFGFEITPCHHLDVQMASNRRRRCFKNTTSISFQNQGSLSAPDAYLLVEFPKWVRPVSATRNYIALNDSVWRFNLDTVSAGESGSFIITDSVLCGNLGILGLSQCTKATIYPAPNCPTGNWNGASLSAAGKCSGNGLVRVSLANKGTGDMLDSTSYRIYLDSILVFQKRVKLVQNDSLVLQVQANGKLVHVEADQVANHPTQYSLVLNVEACGLPGQNISKGFVIKFPLAQSPNSKTHCLPIIGAYDPNDKMVVPQGFTNQNIIPPNTQLEYLVRFQNTGNDTAFTVYLIDTLDTNLNPESLELGAASHNYQLSMQTVKSGKTFLRWQFNNIQLPDSSTNKLKSNGFIQYRISPKANLSLGSKVRNHAEIYFDFNPPIITNQTLSTFGNVVYKDSTLNGNVQIVNALPGKLSPKQIGVNLYPNPVTEHSLTADFHTKGNLTLFNVQGQLVFEKQNIEGKQVLPIQLRTGFYMAQLRTEKGVSVVKVIVE